jgi:hypothetical protein
MLQGVAHDGYGIHAIELLTECENCTSDVILDNPTLEILKYEDQKTVKLLFKNSEHFH